MFSRFWCDEFGGVISPEMVVVGTLLVIGLIAGIASLHQAMNGEIRDIGEAVKSVDFTPVLEPVPPTAMTADGKDDSQSPQTADQVL